MIDSGLVGTLIIVFAFVSSLIFAFWHAIATKKVALYPGEMTINSALLTEEGRTDVVWKVKQIVDAIARGAKSFLVQEYTFCFVFIIVFGLVILISLGFAPGKWENSIFTTISFVLGGLTSILSGYIGMSIAVVANGRTALQAQRGYATAFSTAYRAGLVMGFGLCGLALLVLFAAICLFRLRFGGDITGLYKAIAGYGLGGSSIALFGRVGGGIYTKAADVGADLVGKIEKNIPEDDPRNPAVIADNVGDNVGDIAGMGADLFGSFAESSCAALVVASECEALAENWNSMLFPLIISATGIFSGILTTFLATHIMKVKQQKDIEPSLKRQLTVSTFLETILIVLVSYLFLPETFVIAEKNSSWWKAMICVLCGLWTGLAIGFITEYFTSHAYKPVRELAQSCDTGAATNIIYGLALGYRSVIIPVAAMGLTIFVSFSLADMYGVALAALGILSNLSVSLAIDAYGPISDNAGGIAEMAGLGDDVRERTDALDAAGNTTAAIGKGFAIGSAAFVSLALFGAFVTRSEIRGVDILRPFQFAGLLCGAMLPYWFSSMTMKSVGKAALAMVEEVRRQFREIPGLMEGKASPDYERCVAISTKASLREMLAPGALVMGAPIIAGFCFTPEFVSGMLAGAMVSGVQMAISCSNTGGAWDNAKKYIETGFLGGKGSDCHHAAVIGDTVGDPMKDTSGPSLNILMKLMAVESLVFAPFIKEFNIPKFLGYNPDY